MSNGQNAPVRPRKTIASSSRRNSAGILPGTPARKRWRGERGGILSGLLRILVFLAFIGMIYLLRHPILRTMGQALIVDEAPQHSDAIIILSDDNEHADRARRAAQVYRDGWAPVVVASGRYLRSYISIADLMERDLKEDGVPEKAIVKFPHHALNTVEEARNLRELAKGKGWHHLIVVTSNYHTRRALYDFHRIFPPNVEVRMISAPDSNYDPNLWWVNYRGIKITCVQYSAVPVAMWTLRHDDGGTPW